MPIILERVTIRLPKRYVDRLNWLVEKGVYTNKTEALRTAIRILFEHHGIKLLDKSDLQDI